MVPEREPLQSSSAPASEPQARGLVLQRDLRVRAPVSPDTRKSLPDAPAAVVFHSPHSKAGGYSQKLADGARTARMASFVVQVAAGPARAYPAPPESASSDLVPVAESLQSVPRSLFAKPGPERPRDQVPQGSAQFFLDQAETIGPAAF
jgi:hypothetical protein